MLPPASHPPISSPTLALHDVTLRYKKRTILHQIALSAAKGEVIGAVSYTHLDVYKRQDMVFIEEVSMSTIGNMMSYMLSTLVLVVFMFVLDWRLGLIAVIITCLLYTSQ